MAEIHRKGQTERQKGKMLIIQENENRIVKMKYPAAD